MTTLMHILLVGVSALFAGYSSYAYIRDIIRGVCKPHRTTRFALCIVLLLNFGSIVAAHGNPGALVMSGIFAVLALAAFVLSLRHGVGGKSTFDWICLAIAIGGAIGWELTNNPAVGIWFSIAADLAAYLPTVLKTYRVPHSEGRDTYILGLVSTLSGLAAYRITIASAFQIYLLFIDGLILALIARPRIAANWRRLTVTSTSET